MSAPDPFGLGRQRDDDEDAAENREIAALDFELWAPDEIVKMQEDFSEPAYSKMMGELGVWLRLSSCFLSSTKPQLVELSRSFFLRATTRSGRRGIHEHNGIDRRCSATF